ncbi:hypothetical protein SESBI_45017 [Sesbania bispinosa]|nr:hypothetical protein SESBI_45017 [Sesbania bispinosa]
MENQMEMMEESFEKFFAEMRKMMGKHVDKVDTSLNHCEEGAAANGIIITLWMSTYIV